ncbi:ABC transporter ATP-binding protein/permease [Caldibacillus thermoamylovorans]|uniref:ABC transporter ATP-binding protein n=1 Tax=Caldibacillus thermoamylovorans TaxID=35841 RepID=UPI00203E0355|nr:ABC transporter ATP-binding protein [Caldibacillus thermoamylovorans]MCM3799761.1 ABC transporter ATP-binding protein/permease [Caldibacillus thermoamylovorans]
MKLLLKYLKPFTLTILICIAFLFVQAISELQLPNFMSDMVNNGIQTGGIEEGAPDAISEEGMNLIQLLMDKDSQSIMNDSYTLIEAGSSKADHYKSDYPAVKDKNIYVLMETDQDKLAKTDKAYTQATYALTLSLEDMADEINAAQGNTNSNKNANLSDVDTSKIYEMLPYLTQLQQAGKLDKYISLAAEDDSMAAGQVSTTFTRIFYKELGVNLEQIQNHYIIIKGLQMLGLALLSVVASIVVGWFATKVATTASKNLRKDVFKKVMSFSSAEYDKFSQASLITRSTNDIQQIQVLILMGIRMICYAPIIGIGGIVMALRTTVSISWTIAVAVAALLILMIAILSIAMPKFKMLQTLIDKVNLVSRENLAGMMVIRTFGNEQFEEKRFEKANDHLRKTNRFIQRTMSFLMPAMMLIMNLVSLLIVWVGGKAIADSTLEIGDMMAFIQYAMQIIIAFLMISVIFILVPRALVSAKRVQEVLDTELIVTDSDEVQHLSNPKGKIEFDHVSFRYPDAEESILVNISFVAKPGETTAFIGSTGSGKSTLINLIPRFYDVTEGRITFDGIDIRNLPQKELRDHIGYVPQKGFLFSGDIASNIQYGNSEATEEEIWKAIEVAQGKDFVEEFEEGIHTAISQGGTNVSGGQRQRLSIARALIKKPPVYIFDDSFSALDLKTDAALRKALDQYTHDSTVLIVAQRVSTIINADQIIVLDKGKIVGKGTHKELLESCEEYREIAESQLWREELA